MVVMVIRLGNKNKVVLIQVNCSKHSISETQVMEQRIFSFDIKE